MGLTGVAHAPNHTRSYSTAHPGVAGRGGWAILTVSQEIPALVYLPLKGGGRRAQLAGWGYIGASKQTPTPTLPLSGGGSAPNVLLDMR
jgi:hypothetical protein